MEEMIYFLMEYWGLLVACVCIGALAVAAVVAFAKTDNTEQIAQVKEWLLYAVIEAEKNLGAGTGQVKLRYVYDMFVLRFPLLVAVVSFDRFAEMVTEALFKMQDLLKENEAVCALVGEGE